MEYTPLLIPTLCRYEKFVKCFESLENNTFADKTDVIIALDCPKNDSHKEGYEKIKDFCNKKIGEKNKKFKSITLVCRKRNFGAIKNFESLVGETLKNHDSCICTFDDLEHSKNFLEYMDKMLNEFKNDTDVAFVTGYSYPVSWQTNSEHTAAKQNFEGSIWGVGFWKNEWEEMFKFLRKRQLIKQFPSVFESGKFEDMTDWAIKDYAEGVVFGSATNSLLARVTDIAMRIYLTVNNKYAIMPIISKTKNIGFDGSGAYCEEITYDDDEEITSQNYNFELQPIDTADTFSAKVDVNFSNKENLPIINRFDKRPYGEKEEMITLAKNYCSLGFLNKKALNLKANTRRYTDKLNRMLKR